MVGGKVETLEHMPVVLDFGALCYCESQTAEDIDNLLAHERQGMSGSGDNRRGIAAQVGALSSGLGIVEPVAYFRKTVGGECLEFVNGLPYLTFVFGRHIAKVSHQCVHSTFLAEIFQTQSLELFVVCSCRSADFGLQSLDFLYHGFRTRRCWVYGGRELRRGYLSCR